MPPETITHSQEPDAEENATAEGGVASAPEAVLSAALALWDENADQHWIPITGTSMLPLLRAGDQVLIVHGSHCIEPGHVVVLRQAGRLVAHRVVRLSPAPDRTVITKGDNNLRFDPPLLREDIVGRVIAVRRAHTEFSLDGRTWRLAGRLIAATTAIAGSAYEHARSAKRRLWGDRPSRLASLCQRMAHGSLTLLVRITHNLTRHRP